MKKYIKILIPIATAIVPIAAVSCNKNNHGPVIPKEWLVIGSDELGPYLNGFDKNHQRAYKLEGCNTLTIPKEITHIISGSFSTWVDEEHEYDAPNAIKKLEFEQSCQCFSFGPTSFCFCDNLETVVFPPLYMPYGDYFLFDSCKKLSTFDLSNITVQIDQVTDDYLPNISKFPNNGQIIVKKNQTNVTVFANYLKDKLSSKGWKIIEK